LDKLGDAVKGAAATVGNAAKDAATTVGNAVKDGAAALENARSDVAHEVNNLVQGAQNVVHDIKQNPVVNSVLSTVGDYAQSAQDVLHEVEQNPVVNAVLTTVRATDEAKNQFGSWIDSGKTYLENKVDDGRAWLSNNGGPLGQAASDYIGFGEGVVTSVYDLGKGVVQLANGAGSLINPLEWLANPQANLGRLETAGSAVWTLGKLTTPIGWILDPQGNAQMVGAMKDSIVSSFQNDPSKSAGYAVGTIASMFVPVGGGAAAATRGTEAVEAMTRAEPAAATTMTAAGQVSEHVAATAAGQASEHATVTVAGQAGEHASMTAAGQAGEHASMTASGQATAAAADLEPATVAVGARQETAAATTASTGRGGTAAATDNAGQGARSGSETPGTATASGNGKPPVEPPSKPPTGGSDTPKEPTPNGSNPLEGKAPLANDAAGVAKAAKTVTNVLPENPSQLGHIFRDAPGHLPDTIANRQLLLDTATNPANSFGVNRFGNEVFVSTRADGSQVWVETRNGIIQNGGVNNPPRTWVPGKGLL
jgi:hypothetical protein